MTVPAGYETSEGSNALQLAGLSAPLKQQWIVDAGHLQGAIGRTLTALEFRRTGASSHALASVAADLDVHIGQAVTGSAGAGPVFAQNISGAVLVFDGLVVAPASPVPSGVPGWSANEVVTIPFQFPYSYLGGDLVIDIEGTPVGQPEFWPIDAVEEPAASHGTALSVGAACGPFVNRQGRNHQLVGSRLMTGESVIFSSWGEPGASALMVIGADVLNQPIDLGIVGASGCTAHVLGFSSVATTYGAAAHGAEFGGPAVVSLPVPVDAGLRGVSFASQWFGLGQSLTSSDALVSTIGTSPASLGMAEIRGEAGSVSGVVSGSVAAILRFVLR